MGVPPDPLPNRQRVQFLKLTPVRSVRSLQFTSVSSLRRVVRSSIVNGTAWKGIPHVVSVVASERLVRHVENVETRRVRNEVTRSVHPHGGGEQLDDAQIWRNAEV